MSNTTNLIRKPVVLARTGICNASLYQKIAEGTFPKPVKLGGRAVAWVESEVDQWIYDLIEARDLDSAQGTPTA